jgi:hypothetical protein
MANEPNVDERLRGEEECFYCIDGAVFARRVFEDFTVEYVLDKCHECGGGGVVADG